MSIENIRLRLWLKSANSLALLIFTEIEVEGDRRGLMTRVFPVEEGYLQLDSLQLMRGNLITIASLEEEGCVQITDEEGNWVQFATDRRLVSAEG